MIAATSARSGRKTRTAPRLPRASLDRPSGRVPSSERAIPDVVHRIRGLLLVDAVRAKLVVDFRYAIAARAAVAAAGGAPDGIEVVVAPSSLDDTAIERLKASRALRIGIESQWMSVARFNRVSKGLAADAPTLLASADPCPSLVTTERLIERGRAVKDDVEIATLREAGRRLARVAEQVPTFVREGRTEREVAADIDAPAEECGIRASGLRNDRGVRSQWRPSARPAGAPAAGGRGGGGAGLRGRLRRILRGSDPDGRAWVSDRGMAPAGGRGGGGAGGSHRGRSAGRSGQSHRRRRTGGAGAAWTWARRSATAPATGSGSRCTRSPGSRSAWTGQTGRVARTGDGVHDRAGRLCRGGRRRPSRRRRARDGDRRARC